MKDILITNKVMIKQSKDVSQKKNWN